MQCQQCDSRQTNANMFQVPLYCKVINIRFYLYLEMSAFVGAEASIGEKEDRDDPPRRYIRGMYMAWEYEAIYLYTANFSLVKVTRCQSSLTLL